MEGGTSSEVEDEGGLEANRKKKQQTPVGAEGRGPVILWLPEGRRWGGGGGARNRCGSNSREANTPELKKNYFAESKEIWSLGQRPGCLRPVGRERALVVVRRIGRESWSLQGGPKERTEAS